MSCNNCTTTIYEIKLINKNLIKENLINILKDVDYNDRQINYIIDKILNNKPINFYIGKIDDINNIIGKLNEYGYQYFLTKRNTLK